MISAINVRPADTAWSARTGPQHGVCKWRALALVLVLPLLALGCSSFHREWKVAASTPPPARGITGRWQGTWLSHSNAHTDKLRCLITKQTDELYEARFHAKYQKILSFGYTVILHAKRTEDAFQFDGDADLGWFAGGAYHYEGKATPTNFFSTYRCKGDHGVFQMTRPNPD